VKPSTLYKLHIAIKAGPTYGDGMELRADDTRYVRVDSELQLSELIARIDMAITGALPKEK
jgi:hypothetical protein